MGFNEPSSRENVCILMEREPSARVFTKIVKKSTLGITTLVPTGSPFSVICKSGSDETGELNLIFNPANNDKNEPSVIKTLFAIYVTLSLRIDQF